MLSKRAQRQEGMTLVEMVVAITVSVIEVSQAANELAVVMSANELEMPDAAVPEWIDPTSRFAMVERRVPASAAGTAITAIDALGGRVALLNRSGVAQVPASSLLLQQDDVVHVVIPADSVDRLDHLLAHPGGH